jgi:lysophospholipase L1-like esterase
VRQDRPVRYVAIGDSFTEGVGDVRPDGSLRGWADRVAEGLATTSGGPVQYANLAVRGRKLAGILDEQLPAALALDPPATLLTLNGGGNDMLRPSMDLGVLVALIERAVKTCVTAGAGLVLLSGADPSDHLPFGAALRSRGHELTGALIELGSRYDVPVVSAFDDVEVRRLPYWSDDRLHLCAHGHRRVSMLVLRGLGRDVEEYRLPPGDDDPRGVAHEARYYAEHVVPWVGRRLRGRSSGDGRTGKHLDWVSVAPGVAPG